jgi:hypothetical protein
VEQTGAPVTNLIMAHVRRSGSIAVAVALLLGLIVALSFLVELPIPHDRDFYSLYVADLAMRHGVGLYDEAAHVALCARLFQVDVSTLNLIPWVYPPWYNLATFFLGWLPIRVAARLWFYLNFTMLIAAIGLVTAGWPNSRRQAALVAGMLFVPALGLLFVGQLVAPVLLGTALFVYGVRRDHAWGLGIGLLLLSFKPPSGALIALAAGAWLLGRALRGSTQAKRALAIVAAGGALLLAGAFLLDPTWPGDYLSSLQRRGGADVPIRCDSCASLTFMLARRLLPSTWGPWLIGGLLAASVGALGWWKRPRLLMAGETLTAVLVLLTLLASPYVRNYDFVLLLVPLARGVETASGTASWLIIVTAYLFGWLTLLGPGRPGGSEFLWISAALLLALVANRQEGPAPSSS